MINNNAPSKNYVDTQNASITNLMVEDDIPKIYFNGDITYMTKEVEADLSFSYKSKSESFGGTASMKWQGTSSIAYPKKNFTIKMYTDSSKSTKLKKDFRGWGKQNKFCLKANYIDHSHARNIVSARIWGDIVATRQNIPELLEASPNFGAIDGFPIKLYLNGVYQGIYTWNIPKDGYMAIMDDDNPNHAILCAEAQDGAGAFKQSAVIDGTDWSLEFPDDLTPEISASFNAAIAHVTDTTDEVFKTNFTQHFDLEACIDYYIYSYFMCHLDGLGKNMLMFTYDGQHWIPSMYDMDSTWGLKWYGADYAPYNYECPGDYQCPDSLLWERLVENFSEEIKTRYSELRQTALSLDNVIDRFERFIDLIPHELYAEDVEIFEEIPSEDTNNVKQIRAYAKARAAYVDEQFALLGSLPINVVSGAIGAYGVTKLNSMADKAFRVRNDEGDEIDIGFVGDGLDISTLLDFCGSGNGTVSIIYDQSGNGVHFSQPTAANQPKIVEAGEFKEGFYFDGSDDQMYAPEGFMDTISTFSLFIDRISYSNTGKVICKGSFAGKGWTLGGSSHVMDWPDASGWGSSRVGSMPDVELSNRFTATYVVDVDEGKGYINGTLERTTTGTLTYHQNISRVRIGGLTGEYNNVTIFSLIIWDRKLDSGEVTALNS